MVTDQRSSGVCCYQRCVLLPAVCVVTSGVCCYQRRVLRSSARHPVRIEALGRPKSDGTLARVALYLRQCVWLRTHDPASVCWYGPTIRAQCVLLWTHDPARGTQCEMKHWERQSPTVSMAASLVPEAVCMVTDPRSGQCVLVRTHDPSAVRIVMDPRSSARHPVRNEALGTPKSDGINGGQPCA